MAEKKKIKRDKEVPEKKQKILKELVELMQKNRTTMIASIEGVPSYQYQKIKKALKGKADIKFVKKNLVLMAIDKSKELEHLRNKVDKNFAVLFSQLDPFELASVLSDLKSQTKLKPGQISDKDIVLETGTTDIMAGPALAEFTNAKIKVGVDQGKIAIKEAFVIKANQPVPAEVSLILERLEMKPLTIGIKPLAAIDINEHKLYDHIKIDKEEAKKLLSVCTQEAMNLAINADYICKETINMLLAKANMQSLAISQMLTQNSPQPEPSA
jgi:ribosomal protein L10